MNMKKKSKKVKKYAVGGDLRMSEEGMAANPGFDGSPSSLTFPPFGGGGGGDDGSATGQVKAISKAAGRAGDYLSTAGEAIGQGGRRNNSFDPFERAQPMKKGGKVKKKKKSPTIKARGVGRAVQKKIRPAKMVKM